MTYTTSKIFNTLMMSVVATTVIVDLKEGKDDPKEDLTLARAVDAGRLDQGYRDALEPGREDHHGETHPHPDSHDDERPVVLLVSVQQPCLWFEARGRRR